VALARFTTYVARDRAHPREIIKGYGWRLLAANNRDVARSARLFADVDECVVAIAALRREFDRSVPVSLRIGRSEWSWRLRLDDMDVAVSSRSYQRRLQCTAACELFLELVPQAAVADDAGGVIGPRSGGPDQAARTGL
jgi:uncharacterized protein YegP (UPF0339 family)